MKRTLRAGLVSLGGILVAATGIWAVFFSPSLGDVQTTLSATIQASLNPAHQKNLEEITQIAVKIENETGFPAEAMVAQWAIESEWGERPACRQNYFGIKRSSRNKLGCTARTSEVLSAHQVEQWNRLHPDAPPIRGQPAGSGGMRVETSQQFADYRTLEESCRDYAWMIQNAPPYGVAWARYTATKDPKRLLAELAGIYWSDPDYVKKANAVLNQTEVVDALATARAPSLPSTPKFPRALPPVVLTGAAVAIGNIVLAVVVFIVKQQIRVRQAGEEAKHISYLSKLDDLGAKIELARAEFHNELAEAENRFYQRINGNYVRKEVCGELFTRVEQLESKVDELE